MAQRRERLGQRVPVGHDQPGHRAHGQDGHGNAQPAPPPFRLRWGRLRWGRLRWGRLRWGRCAGVAALGSAALGSAALGRLRWGGARGVTGPARRPAGAGPAWPVARRRAGGRMLIAHEWGPRQVGGPPLAPVTGVRRLTAAGQTRCPQRLGWPARPAGPVGWAGPPGHDRGAGRAGRVVLLPLPRPSPSIPRSGSARGRERPTGRRARPGLGARRGPPEAGSGRAHRERPGGGATRERRAGRRSIGCGRAGRRRVSPRAGHGRRHQPGVLAPVPLGQHRGQVGGHRRPRRRWRADLRPDGRGDPLAQLGAGAGGEIGQAPEVQAGHGRRLVASARTAPGRTPRRRAPAGSGRRRRRSRRAGSRCWMTNVPAKTSPSRLPFADSREQTRAGTPMKGTSQKSTSVARPRTRACRKRSGLPSSPTTRRPSANLPGDLPLVAASQTIG